LVAENISLLEQAVYGLSKMKIQINTICFQYWKRLFWMLSSLHFQEPPIPEILIRINTCLDNDKYRNVKRCICKNFDKLLNLEWINWPIISDFSFKGAVRNFDLSNMKNDMDWMLWIDPDIVFHHTHFNFLYNNLDKYLQYNKLLSIGRINVPLHKAKVIIRNEKYHRPVKDCVLKTGFMLAPPMVDVRAIGFYQLISTKALRDKKILLYSKKAKIQDKNMYGNEKYTTHSEKEFRRKCDSIIFEGCPPVYHLDHLRGEERLNYFNFTSF
jgi:hypothetical protein